MRELTTPAISPITARPTFSHSIDSRYTLRGIPTIRPFEALACGIPLISAPWEDSEHLFTPGADFLVARNGVEMRTLMNDVMHDDDLAASLVSHGLATILARHTCAHRVDQLLAIAGVPERQLAEQSR